MGSRQRHRKAGMEAAELTQLSPLSPLSLSQLTQLIQLTPLTQLTQPGNTELNNHLLKHHHHDDFKPFRIHLQWPTRAWQCGSRQCGSWQYGSGECRSGECGSAAIAAWLRPAITGSIFRKKTKRSFCSLHSGVTDNADRDRNRGTGRNGLR